MSTITIDGVEHVVTVTLRPGFVIADAGGAFACASFDDVAKEWNWYGGEVTPEDAAALRKIIEENGGFDKTTVVVEPPAK